MKELSVYIAGKVSKESIFGTHHWRDEFCETIAGLSGRKLVNLDPIADQEDMINPEEVFSKDVKLIYKCNVMIVYLSDDISVGGSQEILIAKYFKKPVIGFAPYGGKFNGSTREMLGKTIEDYKDPFVFSTCDIVCGTLEEVAAAIQNIESCTPKDISLIENAL